MLTIRLHDNKCLIYLKLTEHNRCINICIYIYILNTILLS